MLSGVPEQEIFEHITPTEDTEKLENIFKAFKECCNSKYSKLVAMAQFKYLNQDSLSIKDCIVKETFVVD